MLMPLTVLAAPVGKVTHLEGQADVTVQGVTTPCRQGMEVNAGDIVRTKKQSRVGITLVDGNMIWVAPLSRLRVTQYSPEEGKQNYCDLFRGKTRVVVNAIAKGSSLEVHTPTAVAGVRGTIFIGFFERGQSGFIFERGSGYGYNRQMPSKVVTIEAGHIMVVPKTDQEPVVRPATRQEIDRHIQDTTGGEEKKAEQEKPTEKAAEGAKEEKKEAEAKQATEAKPEPTTTTDASVTTQVAETETTTVQGTTPSPPPVETPTVLPEPPPPVPVPTATTTDLKPVDVSIDGISGQLTGSVDDKTNKGTLKFAAAGALPNFSKVISGTLSDGSSLDAYLAGVTGSWSGLFYGLAKKGESISLFSAVLEDKSYTGSGTLSASGTLERTSVWKSTSGLAEYEFYAPYFSGVSAQGLAMGMSNGTLYGYEGAAGKIYGIWGSEVVGGAYEGVPVSATVPFGYVHYAEDVLAAVVVGTGTLNDDGAGHVQIGVDHAYYMDGDYYGEVGMSHRGVYAGTDYRGITAGAGLFTPLSYSGFAWGSLFDIEESTQGYIDGLVGGTSGLPWSGSADIKMLGWYYTYPGAAEKRLLWHGLIGDHGYGTDGSYVYTGYALGIWGAEIPGSYRGVYFTEGAGGFLESDDLTFTSYPIANLPQGFDGVWMAQGSLAARAMSVPPGFAMAGFAYLFSPLNLTGTSQSPSVFGQGEFWASLPKGSDGQILPWGLYEAGTSGVGLQGGITNWEVIMGGVESDSSFFAFLGESQGTRSEPGIIRGEARGDFVTPTLVGTFEGPVYGADDGSGNWGTSSIGTMEGKPSLFGGEWTHSTIYNDSGTWAWNGDFDRAYFGLTERTDGKLDFLAIGGFWDKGYGAAGYGGPYILSGALYDSPSGSRTLFEGFTGGIMTKAAADLSGTITDYLTSLYGRYEGGSWQVGLIRGDLSGHFYEMFRNEPEEKLYDMFRLKGTTAGLEVKEKTALLPPGLGENDVWIYFGGFSNVRFAGSFDGTGEIIGDYYWGKTKFLGYSQGDKTISLPFGIYNLKIGAGNSYYEDKPAGSEVSFRARVGGMGAFGYEGDGYWLASVNGNSWMPYADGADHGTITGTLSGRYLTPTQMGTMTGPFYGLYQGSGEGTWIGLAVGTYEGESLAMSASLSGHLASVVPGSFRVREFLRPYYRTAAAQSWFDPLQYEAIYFVPQGGGPDIMRTFSHEKVEIPGSDGSYYDKGVPYFPTGKWMALEKGNGITQVIGGGDTDPNWSLAGDTPSAVISQNLSFFANPDPGTSTFTYGVFVPAYDVMWEGVNGIMVGNEIEGRLGVLAGQDLWTSAPSNKASMVMMGTHGEYSGHELVFMSGYSDFGKGAFFADVLGIIRKTDAASGNPMDGLLIGLYADGEGKVGVLKGEWTGSSYPEIGMWEAGGGATAAIYRDGTLKDFTGSSVTPDDLISSRVLMGAFGLGTNSTLYGTFDGSGYVRTPVGIIGRTYSLDDQPDWGIFRLTAGLVNEYDKPAGTGTGWSGTLFGDGTFGRYPGSSPYNDLGMWYADLTSGTWENGKITGNFAGEFVTLLKKGAIEGRLLGTYDGNGTSWQAVGAGTWSKSEEVYFGSEIWGKSYVLTHQKYGGLVKYNYSYSFQFNDQGYYRYGSGVLTEWTNPSSPEKYTYYWYGMEGPEGAPQRHIWTHTTANDIFTYQIEDYEDLDAYYAALENLARDPKTGSPITLKEAAAFLKSDFSGVFAGLDNLWANIGVKGTPVYLLGDTNMMDAKGPFDLFRAEVVSVDPLESSDPYANSKSRVWEGKYGAYFGFLGGRNDASAHADGLSVMFKGFYLDQAGNFGLLYTDPTGPLTGTVNEEVGMWKALGEIFGYALGTGGISGVTAENFASKLSMEGYYSPISLSADNVVGSGSLTMEVVESTNVYLPEPYFNTYRIGQQISAGTYNGTSIPTAWTWTMEAGTDTSWILTEVTATRNNTFDATSVEAHVNWQDARTYVAGGEVKGIFNPSNSTWKAVANSFQMETGALISKLNSLTSDEARQAFQQATRIPAFEIGRANLTGMYSDGHLTIDMQSASYGMRDVVFLAPSNDARPQIWATGSVSGHTTGQAVTPGTTVSLSDAAKNISADFTFKAYMPCESKWSATVSGNAPSGLGNYTSAFTFQGGAAGTIQGTVGSGDFTFSGTAAGIVPPK